MFPARRSQGKPLEPSDLRVIMAAFSECRTEGLPATTARRNDDSNRRRRRIKMNTTQIPLFTHRFVTGLGTAAHARMVAIGDWFHKPRQGISAPPICPGHSNSPSACTRPFHESLILSAPPPARDPELTSQSGIREERRCCQRSNSPLACHA